MADERARQRFACRQGLLRELLAAYTGIPPRSIELKYGQLGKPSLAGAAEALRFNLAESDGLAVYTVASGRDVGVDVEHCRRAAIVDRLVSNVLTATERALLASLEPQARSRTLLRGWTRKEALLKALGAGIALPMHAVDVLTQPDDAIPFPNQSTCWRIADVPTPSSSWIAAMAVADTGHGLRLRCRAWTARCALAEGSREDDDDEQPDDRDIGALAGHP